MRSNFMQRAPSLRWTVALATLALALVSAASWGLFVAATADLRSAGASADFARAIEWYERSKLCAAIAATATAAIVVAMFRWIQTGSVRPIRSLDEAMGRFATGDREVRVRALGCAELRQIAEHFNDMAGALARERTAQMTFLAAVAHDLKNPLCSLKLCLRLGGDPALAAEMAARAERQVARMDRMIGDLLDIARIEAGELEVKLERQDLRDLVRRALEPFQTESTDRAIEVVLPEEPVTIACDALRLEQVIANLVSNALKYSPPGSPIEVRVERTADRAALRVIDRGVGISAEDQKRLFQPFRRVGPAAERVAGVGLGLSVVRRITHAHGGQVAIDSELGRGSAFTVRLPLG